MNLQELTEKSLVLRKKYEELETKTYGRPWSNVELMAAFSADFGKLSKLIMAKEGLRKDTDFSEEKLAHEFADCLWCLLVLANKLGIDLEDALKEMIADKSNKLINK